MRYTIKNLTNGRVSLPPPVGRSLGGGQALVVDAPASLMEQVDPSIRGSNKFQRMKNAGLISIQSETEPLASLDLEVPTQDSVFSNETLRFLSSTSPQTIYVDPNQGSDINGDGLNTSSSYATIQRAFDDIPDGYKVDIIIQLAAGSFAGQNAALHSLPDFTSTGGTPMIYIVGNQTAAYSFANSGSGSLVSGKAAQVAFTQTHGLSITDGSHWMTSSTASVPSLARVLRTSGSTQIIPVQSSTTALTDQKICAYNTIFTSSFRIAGPIIGHGNGPLINLVGIKFNALAQATRVLFNGVNVNTGTGNLLFDCNIFSGYFGVDINLFDEGYARRTVFNSLFAGKLLLNGARSSLQQCVFSSSLSAGNAKLNLGTNSTSEPPMPSTSPSGIRLVSAVDFEGTGNAMHLAGHSYLKTSGTLTFAITGRTLFMNGHCAVNASSAQSWTGTATLPARIRRVSSWDKTSITYSVTNTSNAGQDFDVGAAATIIAASGTNSDTTDFSQYR